MPITDRYPDGCPIAPACADCPLPACLVELRGSLHYAGAVARAVAITRRYRAGEHPRALATEYGVARTSVYRMARTVHALGVMHAPCASVMEE